MMAEITDWPLRKRDEVARVFQYLKNEGIDFQMSLENIDVFPDEPADVWVKDINKKFQVVVANFKLFELLGRARPDENGVKMIESGGTHADVWREIILEPLEKKRKYGAAARGITLLICPPFNPPWVEDDIKRMRAENRQQELSTMFFDEIFLVLHGNNIKIFP